MVSQITGVSIVCSIVNSGGDQRKHQSSASLAFVWGIQRWPGDKRPVTRKMFLFGDVIILPHYKPLRGIHWWPQVDSAYRESIMLRFCFLFFVIDLDKHTLFYFSLGMITPCMKIKRRSSHIESVSRLLCLRSANDVTIICWWRYHDSKIAKRPRDKWYLIL